MSDDARFLGLNTAGWAAIGSLGVFCTVSSFVFGVVQYTQALEEKRAERTLELVKEWRGDGYRDSFNLLAETTAAQMTANITEAEIAFLDGNDEAREKVAAKLANLVLAEEPDASDALDEVVYFFNLLGLCVEANMCSEATAAGFFDNTLIDFHSIYEAPIDARRETLPDYASGMLRLLARFENGA